VQRALDHLARGVSVFARAQVADRERDARRAAVQAGLVVLKEL